MQDTNALIELVSGYDAYADAGELTPAAVSDAPATTVACLVWTIGFNTAGSIITIIQNC